VRIRKAIADPKKSEGSQWSNTIHQVTAIHHNGSGDLYDVSNFGHPLIRADLLRIASASEELPSQLPVGPPLHERLNQRQLARRRKFMAYAEEAERLLPEEGMQAQALARAIFLKGIPVLEFVRLYPDKFVLLRHLVKRRHGLSEEERAQAEAQAQQEELKNPTDSEEEDEEPPPPPPEDDEPPPPPPKAPPPPPPPHVPPPPKAPSVQKVVPRHIPGARDTDYMHLRYGFSTPEQVYARIQRRQEKERLEKERREKRG
jgi:hypothetical protein